MEMMVIMRMTVYGKHRFNLARVYLSARSRNKQMEILLAARLRISSGVAVQFHFKASLSRCCDNEDIC